MRFVHLIKWRSKAVTFRGHKPYENCKYIPSTKRIDGAIYYFSDQTVGARLLRSNILSPLTGNYYLAELA